MDKTNRIKQVRNKKLLPDLRKEGDLSKEIVLSTKEKHGVPTGSRLYSHHTLASVRKLSFFHPFFLPEDSLDLVLAAVYNHSTERFADKEDLYLQPETIGCDTWRRLRNTYDKLPPVVIPLVSTDVHEVHLMVAQPQKTFTFSAGSHNKGKEEELTRNSPPLFFFQIYQELQQLHHALCGHPMKRGGISEKHSPFSVKLMNSGVHSSQTNPGFSRQAAGGAIFFY